MANVNFDRLSKLPALEGLTPEEMTAFFTIATKHAFQPGDPILKTGEKADCFFLVAAGQLEILLPQGKGVPATPIAQVGSGQLVGEMPLLYAQPLRQADVIAASEAVLLRFAYGDYERLAQAHPQLANKFRRNLGKIVAGRVWSTIPTQGGTGPLRAIEEPQKAPQTSNHDAMKAATIFAGLKPDELQAIEAIALPFTAQAEQPIVHQGSPADSFYLIVHGHCEVRIPKDGQAMPVARLGSGQVFGEMALVYKQPERTADVVAVTEAKLLNFPFDDYQRLTQAMPEIGRKLRNNLGRVAASRSWTMQADQSKEMQRRSSSTGNL
ncbi:cyclic nucleotide-binding domain-containing protein [bacterium]|nr:cyclic nucleotide-binding domain-containing protein [bacterium]